MDAEIYQLPYPDDSFDMISMFDAIEHIGDDNKAMNEVARILKPGGSIIISVPAYQFLFSNSDRTAQHYRRYNRRSVQDLFENSGLTVKRNTHTNVILFPVILPIILLNKFKEAYLKWIAPSTNNHNLKIPNLLNTVFYKLFSLELGISKSIDIPVGHSIAAIAKLGLDDAD
jgi:ubiquinone/menaquinone biosynthesis C-methylase UbiE